MKFQIRPAAPQRTKKIILMYSKPLQKWFGKYTSEEPVWQVQQKLSKTDNSIFWANFP